MAIQPVLVTNGPGKLLEPRGWSARLAHGPLPAGGNAKVAELVDALDLGSSASRRGGSSPFLRTMNVFGFGGLPELI
jgi:hypothetical protein